jgi:DNA-binding beta-propeller fold protein YncE
MLSRVNKDFTYFKITLPALGLFLFVSLWAFGDSGWIYALNQGDAGIYVIDVDTGELISSIPLGGKAPNGLFPTPGGKFVFVTSMDSELVSVVDVEKHQEVKTFIMEGGIPGIFTFSSMGQEVYVTRPLSEEIRVYLHQRSVLEMEERFSLGIAGAPILLNRRGTRVYRSSAEGLEVVYLKTKEIIKTLTISGGARIWSFSPDYRYLWGVGADGIVVVDEPKLRTLKTVMVTPKPHAAVFSQDGKKAFLIEKSGRRVVVLNKKASDVAGEISFGDFIDSMALAENGTLWIGSSQTSALYTLDTDTLEITGRVDLPGIPIQIRYVTLKKGEGYACF